MDKSTPDYGRRLLVDVVDQVAASDPTRPFVYAPRSSNPEDGWAPTTWKQFANAVNHVAHVVAKTVKADSGEAFPTLAYIGPNDVRYGVVMLACVKAGCQALFVSPRNSLEAQLSLLERTRCRHLWHPESLASLVEPWLRAGEGVKAAVVPPAADWLDAQPQEAFPYAKPFEQARFKPLVVVHTSGSTGLPKPIVLRQGSVAIADGFRRLPEHQGCEYLYRAWARESKRMFSPMPLFHVAALAALFAIHAIYYDTPLALGVPDQPLSPHLVLRCLENAGVDSAFLPPSIIEELSQDDEGLAALRKLNVLMFGGGSLSQLAGDLLTSKGVMLSNAIASTEYLPYALFFQRRPELWKYFVFNSDVMGADWRCHDEAEGTYELVVHRKHADDPGEQPPFYTFPDLTEWSTGDLFKAHPSLPDHWAYYGRADSVIVFSTGEKLNPVSIEDMVRGHPAVKGALVVGTDRLQPALIMEPHLFPEGDDEARALVDSVWPLVERANESSVAHGRIVRQLVALSDPETPFPYSPKGTIQRQKALKAYAGYIDALYARVEELEAQATVPLDLGSEAALAQSIAGLVAAKVGTTKDVEPDTDIFSLGIDSMQVMSLARVLRGSLDAAGGPVSGEQVVPRTIYAHPTARSLAAYLLGAAGGSEESAGAREIKVLGHLVDKYTRDLPEPRAGKPAALDDGQTVLLTGSTGSLGAYLLDGLCRSPRVSKVVALNRGDDGGRSRQPAASAARGLGTDFSKVDFVGADLARPDLGLGPAKYAELLATADRVIHNAWPVNFNISVASFEPHVRGVRHLVDLASAALKRVQVVFLSSVSTAAFWDRPEPVPEEPLADLALAYMGYGCSKLAASLILDAAASSSRVPTTTVRIGQIAGPRGPHGMWNKQEWLPTLIASSVYLGMLPRSIGPMGAIDWMPVEDVADLVLDVSGVTARNPVDDVLGYFHAVNPSQTTWAELAGVLLEYYQGRINKLVSLEEWVAALEETAASNAGVDKNPAIKLIDTFQGMKQASEAGKRHVDFSMARTMRYCPTLAHLGPITADLLKMWCSQWNY